MSNKVTNLNDYRTRADRLTTRLAAHRDAINGAIFFTSAAKHQPPAVAAELSDKLIALLVAHLEADDAAEMEARTV